jgi:hypothetical protein
VASSVAQEVTMMGAVSGKTLDWIRKGVKLFGAPGFEQAYDEFRREDQLIFHMLTAPAQIQPDLHVLVQQLNESSADEPSGSSTFQTTREIMAEIAEEWDQMSTPESYEQPFDGMSRIWAVMDSLPRISTSRNRYLERDLEISFFMIDSWCMRSQGIHMQQDRSTRRPVANADIV